MSRMTSKHTIESAKYIITEKGFSEFIEIIGVDNITGILYLKDVIFGEYKGDIKGLCPKTTFPLHPFRRKKLKLLKAKEKYINSKVKGFLIKDLFYGPDQGYKNRSYYIVIDGECGHPLVTTMASISKHKTTFNCSSCSRIKHGGRALKDGGRIKRSSTYNYWVKVKNNLPSIYQEFNDFRDLVGDRPDSKAKLKFVDQKLMWVGESDSEDSEIQLISSSLRQSFRYSKYYKDCLNAAKVETGTNTLYRCANCGSLSTLDSVQVDHIDPVKPIDGSPLTKDNIIERVWTDRIQVLDRACHLTKSTEENKLRRANKNRT